MTARRKRSLGRVAAAVIGIAVAAALAGAFYVGYFASDPVKLVLPVERRGNAKIVFLSGDLGLNMGMGPRIVRQLAQSGLPVLGFNSLTYFRTRRTPREISDEVSALIERAQREFGPGPTIMVGQSFGADALQLALADLSPELRRKIALVILVVPTDSIYLRASPDEMFNFSPPDLPAISSGRKLDWVPVLCVYGREEDHSLCPLLKADNVSTVALPGDHYLDHDVVPVARTIKQTIARTLPR